jgi:hypothetical protein
MSDLASRAASVYDDLNLDSLSLDGTLEELTREVQPQEVDDAVDRVFASLVD